MRAPAAIWASYSAVRLSIRVSVLPETLARRGSVTHAILLGRVCAVRDRVQTGASKPDRIDRVARCCKAGSSLGQRDAHLTLVLAAAIAIRGFVDFVGLEENHLGAALVGVDARRQ